MVETSLVWRRFMLFYGGEMVLKWGVITVEVNFESIIAGFAK